MDIIKFIECFKLFLRVSVQTPGIGTLGSTSLVVQYQAEINELQEMINNTLGRVEEIERYCVVMI